MILIGQYDSPFVRRVGIALTLYELPFAHQPWSSFGDAEKIRAYNPLIRVPALVLDDGDVLIDSHLILDHLDHLVPPDRRLFPTHETARRKALKIAGLATGLGDKSVSLFYERRLHREASGPWVERCLSQMHSALAALEADRSCGSDDYWFGERIGHADIAVAAVLRFISEALPGLIDMPSFPALQAHAGRLEALPAFKTISQPFAPPA
jgi:glutathione S-transferase